MPVISELIFVLVRAGDVELQESQSGYKLPIEIPHHPTSRTSIGASTDVYGLDFPSLLA